MEDRRQGRHRQHRKSSCRCPSASWRGSARRVHSAWSPGISRVRYERIVFPNLSRADVPRPELFSRVRVSQHPRAVGSRQSGTRIECRPAADRGLAREAHRRTGDPTFSPRGKHRRPVAPEHPGGAGLGRRAVTVSQRCRSSLLAACVYWLAPRLLCPVGLPRIVSGIEPPRTATPSTETVSPRARPGPCHMSEAFMPRRSPLLNPNGPSDHS